MCGVFPARVAKRRQSAPDQLTGEVTLVALADSQDLRPLVHRGFRFDGVFYSQEMDMKPFAATIAIVAFAFAAAAAEKKVELKNLPQAVQNAVAEQTRNAELKGLSKETEHGVTSYEIETVANGRHRDVTVDAKGNVTTIEEETPIDSIPAAAKAAIEKKVASGKIAMVEAVTKNGALAFYEASYATKSGKKAEFAVKPDGTPTKED